jgi:hypothetical protein
MFFAKVSVLCFAENIEIPNNSLKSHLHHEWYWQNQAIKKFKNLLPGMIGHTVQY